MTTPDNPMSPKGSDLGKGNGPQEGSFNPAVAGSLMGTSKLQTAIESNTKAMDDLADQIREMKSSISSMGQGQGSSSDGSSMHGGVNGGPHTFHQPMGGNPNQYNMSAPQPMSGPTNGAGGGGFGGGGGNGGSPSWMGRPNAGGSTNVLAGAMGGGGVRGAAQAFGNFASNQMSNQVALNTYQQYGSYMGGNHQQIASSLMGSGGNMGMAQMGQSIPDLLAMGSIIQQASGAPNAGFGGPGTNALSRQMYGGAAASSFLNPGMSGQQAAGLSADIFSPMTSFRLHNVLGMGASQVPLSGGGANKGMAQMSQAQFFANLNQRFGTQNMSKGQYANFMKTGGYGQYALGQFLPQQDIPGATAAMEAQHGLSLRGWSTDKIQQTLQAAEGGDTAKAKAARMQLQKAGIATSDVAKLQSANAPNASRLADSSKGFTTGLNAVTSTVQKFNSALAHMMKSTGLDQYVGLAAGVAGTTKALEPGLGHHAGRALGHLRNVRGGGANSPATVPTSKQNPQQAPASGGGSAVKAVQAAESQMGLPYIWGGETPGKGFDCSGLTQWAYKQAGVNIPRTSQQQWAALQGKSVPLNQVQEGDLVFAAGSDGTVDAPGHVALMISGNQVIQAAHTGTTIGISGYNAGAWQHAARPGTGGGGNNGGTGSGGSAVVPRQGSKVSTGNGFNDPGTKGLGDILTGGSTKETSAFMTGVTGGARGGSGYYGNNNGKYIDLTAANGGTTGAATGAPAGGGTGGQAVYNYLLSALFGGNKIAAAGATASIWGESKWDPESQGTGGRGLIGWTPPSTLPNSAFTGNASKDMAAQLPLIVKFVNSSGDQGVIQQMLKATSVEQAAALWDHGVERAGINDVHSQGIALAKQFAGLAKGGAATKGQFAWVGERGPELVRFNQDAQVMNADQTAKIAKSAMSQSPQGPFSAGTTMPYAYSPHNPIFAGQGKSGGKGSTITLQFDEKAISVNLPTGTTDTGASGRAMAEAFVKQISTTDLYRSIATGQKT